MTRNKRSKKNKILIVSFIIILILGLGAFAYFYRPVLQSSVAVQDQCYVTRSEVGTTTSFKCDGTKCDAKVYAYCDDKTADEAIVTFRTNAMKFEDFDYRTGRGLSGRWIAINCVPNGKACIETPNLIGYCPTGVQSSGGSVDINRETPFRNIIRVYNSKLMVLAFWGDSAHTLPRYEYYETCSIADTTITPKEPYKSNNQEQYSGTMSQYSCSQDILINNLKYTTITYSNPTNPGTFSSDIIHLKKDDILSSPGAKIDWAVIDDSRACSASQCNTQKTGYYECSSGSCPQLSTVFKSCATGEFCTQTASGAKCGAPFITNGLVTGGRVTGTPITF